MNGAENCEGRVHIRHPQMRGRSKAEQYGAAAESQGGERASQGRHINEHVQHKKGGQAAKIASKITAYASKSPPPMATHSSDTYCQSRENHTEIAHKITNRVMLAIA